MTILKPWLAYDLKQLNGSGVSSQMVDAFVEQLAEKNASDDVLKDFQVNVLILTEFLDTAYICIEADLCDAEVMKQSFLDFARSFHCLYRPIIEGARSRSNLQSFGSGLEKLASGSSCAQS